MIWFSTRAWTPSREVSLSCVIQSWPHSKTDLFILEFPNSLGRVPLRLHPQPGGSGPNCCSSKWGHLYSSGWWPEGMVLVMEVFAVHVCEMLFLCWEVAGKSRSWEERSQDIACCQEWAVQHKKGTQGWLPTAAPSLTSSWGLMTAKS